MQEVFAYLAGAMDSDGSFGIKKDTYAMRVRKDAHQPTFSEQVSLKQVTLQIPQLLKDTFGGYLALTPPSTVNGKPLWAYAASDCTAANIAKELLPFLRVKRHQAELILELRESKSDARFHSLAYWYALEHPHWQNEILLSFEQVKECLSYRSISTVGQAVRNGTLLALPYERAGNSNLRVPEGLVEVVIQNSKKSKDGRPRCRPSQLIAWRQRLWDEMRELNRIGVGEHPVYLRTGPFKPATTLMGRPLGSL